MMDFSTWPQMQGLIHLCVDVHPTVTINNAFDMRVLYGSFQLGNISNKVVGPGKY